MAHVTVIARPGQASQVAAYLSFGAAIVEQGKTHFQNQVAIIITIPDDHADWLATRLQSGNFGAVAHATFDSLEKWKEEFGYQVDSVPIVNRPHALYYDGELIGIITNADPHSNIEDLCECISPDEGAASAVPITQPSQIADLLNDLKIPATIPVPVYDDDA
jgi:hypothetical protein